MLSFLMEVVERMVTWTVALTFGVVVGLIKGIYRALRRNHAEPEPEEAEESPTSSRVPARVREPSAPVAQTPHITTNVHVHLPPQFAPTPAASTPPAAVAERPHLLAVADNRIYITQASHATMEHPLADELDGDITRYSAMRMARDLKAEVENIRLDESGRAADRITLPPFQGLELPAADGALWLATPSGFTRTEAPALTLPKPEDEEREPGPVSWQMLHAIPEPDGELCLMSASGVSRVSSPSPAPR